MQPARVMFLYWGRRGPITRLALEIGRTVSDMPGIEAWLSVSRQNEAFGSFRQFGDAVLPADTFETNIGALKGIWRLPSLKRVLAGQIAARRIQAVITLMPHVWTPFVIGAVHKAGARYTTIVHDSDPHQGDATAAVHRLLRLDAHRADLVFTLSQAVAGRLSQSGAVDPARLVTVFHPDLSYASAPAPRRLQPGRPFRVLFFGRIRTYKGLGRFVEMVEILRARGMAVEAGVFGEGSVAPFAARLAALGAVVDNRWVSDSEVPGIFARYDAVVLAHHASSQSGVASAALGAGLPLVATPVGGLVEQVIEGETGVLAGGPTAADLAEAVERLAEPSFYDSVARRLSEAAENRSVRAFVSRIVPAAVG